ncbi:MAG: hypothetical protein N4A35_09120 [Flavobacteriales bacterium]|jgi:hypothetical protein|nr:hypothetical protein [Flavobacteriales bacterium]
MLRLKKIVAWLALILLTLSLFLPVYCTNEDCTEVMRGFNCFFFGWMGTFLFFGIYLVWLANPIAVMAFILNKKKPKISLLLSGIAFLIGSAFLLGGEIFVTEARAEEITDYRAGYWLWMSSLLMVVVVAVLSLLIKAKQASQN